MGIPATGTNRRFRYRGFEFPLFPVDNGTMRRNHSPGACRRVTLPLCFFILLGVAAFPVFADTVFIGVHLPADSEEEFPEEVISAFEDGVMEPFFDSYHIVCNSRDSSGSRWETAKLKENGIDFYVSVDLLYTALPSGGGVLDAGFSMERVTSDRTLYSGRTVSEEFEESGGGGGMAVYTLQGRAVASELLSAMVEAM